MDRWLHICAGDVDLSFDPEIGNIRRFAVAGREILHTAHWVGTPLAATAASAIDRHLAGDFLAAPFGTSDLLDDPPHGWSANSLWAPVVRAGNGACATLKLELIRAVMGARLSKELSICAGQPVLYQRHRIEGGQGGLTYAHHPMIRVSPGDHIAYSPKRVAVTAPAPLEPAHRLAYPARSADLSAFPAADGGTIDLTRYSDRAGHEDFVTLVEAAARGIGWTAVSRVREHDIVIFLKDIAMMPVTMLWISNGGRDYAPWNGEHLGVLGVEDGCAAGAEGHRAALSGRSRIGCEGVVTSQQLLEEAGFTLRHAIAVLPQPAGWTGTANVEISRDQCRVTGRGGETCQVAFNGAFFTAG
ncbi:hypothetical protein [Celeribacter neptunius]|uniref:Uncharacterized protein n=1 Tax=Celeribacter neptunius TaxID=588602 RepID=A0A1I3KGW3_9RHOB|nr:hypothetical protein [Celeribacter neptunius]SFI71580.1 hypothetical protein SAMN04487991_0684 [Celeribacter neptunius]